MSTTNKNHSSKINDQDFSNIIGVKQAVLSVPVRKPGRQEFIRTHPDDSYRIDTAVLELREERETYLVRYDLWSALADEIMRKTLITTINRRGVLFLWPIRLPGGDGHIDEWSRAALEAASIARNGWVRLVANRSLGRTMCIKHPAHCQMLNGRH